LVATPGYGTGAIVEACVEVVALSLPVLLAEEFLEDVLALPGDGGPLGLSKRVWISTLTAGAGSNASKVKFGRSCDCWVVTRWVLFGIR
jgi:hypothetical protein